MAFELDQNEYMPKIKVIGVGGGGGTLLIVWLRPRLRNVEFIAINTDEHVLRLSKASQKIQIGEKATAGKGAGLCRRSDRRRFEESRDEIGKDFSRIRIWYLLLPHGRRYRYRHASRSCQIAKDMGILTVGVVTKPVCF